MSTNDGPAIEAPFDARAEARRLLRTSRWATLATLDRRAGGPYASLISFAADLDGAPLLLISRLAVHTRNLEIDPLCSILLAQVGAGDPLLHPRVSLTGHAEKTDEPRASRRFLACHPDAAFYAGFADFAFYRMVVQGAHLVAGFGRIVDIPPEDLLLAMEDAAGLLAAEEEAVAHVNADHADAVALYATRLLGRREGSWRVTGIDPEGCDLALEEERARLLFSERVTSPAELRMAFQQLATLARG